MYKKNNVPAFLASGLLFVLSACSKSDPWASMPELNEANCAPEQIAKIKNEAVRADFSSRCLRLGTLTPSKKREW